MLWIRVGSLIADSPGAQLDGGVCLPLLVKEIRNSLIGPIIRLFLPRDILSVLLSPSVLASAHRIWDQYSPQMEHATNAGAVAGSEAILVGDGEVSGMTAPLSR